MLDGLEDAGVNTAYLNTVEAPSGVARITTGAGGENNIVVMPGANGDLTPKLLERRASVLKNAGFPLAQPEVPLETVEYLAAFADRHDIRLMLDPAPARKLSTDLLQRVTWITPNQTEMQELLETHLENDDQGSYTAADRLLACGVKNVVLKLGARGCVIAGRNLPKERVAAFSVNAVDTTAAGDAFNAGFAVGLMRGSTVKGSAVFASAVAAISVTRHGAQPSMPTSAEVTAFLRERLGAEASLIVVETAN